MEMQLDDVAARMLKESLIERGLKFEMKASTKELAGKKRVEKVHPG